MMFALGSRVRRAFKFSNYENYEIINCLCLIHISSFVSTNANGQVPQNAVAGGYDGGLSYHARAVVDGKKVPGKAGIDSKGLLVKAGIPYGKSL